MNRLAQKNKNQRKVSAKALVFVLVALIAMSGLFANFGSGAKKTFAAPGPFLRQINYQGKLTDSNNVAVADGIYNVVFTLYYDDDTQAWQESTTIDVTNGLFSYMLGSQSPLDDVDFSFALELGINVEGDGEMTPRKVIGAIPVAFNADKLDGVSSGQFLRSDTANSTSTASTYLSVTQTGAGKVAEFFGPSSASVLSVLSTGNVGIGTTSPYARLSVAGETVAAYFTATTTTASTFPYASTTALTVSGSAYFPGGGIWNSLGNIGIGTTTPSSNLTIAGVSTGGEFNIFDVVENQNLSLSVTGGLISLSGTAPGVSGAFTAIEMYPEASSGYLSFSAPTLENHYINNDEIMVLNANGVGINVGGTHAADLAVAGDVVIGNTYRLMSGPSNGLLVEGAVSIGEVSPANKFTVSGNAAFGTGYDQIAAPTNGMIVEGNVGIGTTSPYARLSVAGETVAAYFTATTTTASTFPYASTTALSATSLCLSTDCRTSWPSAGGSSFGQSWEISNGYLAPTTTLGIFVSASSTIGNGTQKGGLTISGGATTTGSMYVAGNVGIGTTSPFARLSVVGQSSGLGLDAPMAFAVYGGSDTGSGGGKGGGILLQSGNGDINEAFGQPGGDGGTLEFIGGNGGLSFVDNGGNGGSLYLVGGIGGAGGISSGMDGNVILGMTSAGVSRGNVGVGTSSPYAKLSVVGQVVSSYYTATSTTATSSFAHDVAVTGRLKVLQSGTLATIIGDTSGDARGTNALDIQSTRTASTQVASGFDAIAIGMNNTASDNGVAIGRSNSIPSSADTISVAIGYNNTSSDNDSAFGLNNTASGINASAFGNNNTAIGQAGISSAFGYSNTASGDASVAFGANNRAVNTSSTAFGQSNQSSGATGLAFGHTNYAHAINAVLFGNRNFSSTNGLAALAMGLMNNQTGGTLDFTTGAISGTATGTATVGRLSSAFGILNTVSGNYGQAFGLSNNISVAGGSVFGSYITNSLASSTQIGSGDDAKLVIRGDSGFQGFVGIGTSSPYAKLSVTGQIVGNYFTATSTVAASTFPYASTTAISATAICISADCRTAWPTGGGASFGEAWTITNGYLRPTTTLGILVNASSTIGNGNLGLTIDGRSTTTGTAYFAGNVGIGTTSPYAKLSIVSNGLVPKFVIATTTGANPLFFVNSTTTGEMDWARIAVGTTTFGGAGLRDQFTVSGRIYSTWKEFRCDNLGAAIVTGTSNDTSNICGPFSIDADTDGGVVQVADGNPGYGRLRVGNLSGAALGEGVSLRTWNTFAPVTNNPVIEAMVRATVNLPNTMYLVGYVDWASGSDTATLPTNGIYYVATSTNNWIAVSRVAGSDRLYQDTGVATSSLSKLRIEVTSNGAIFLADNSVVEEINGSSNIPDSSVNMSPAIAMSIYSSPAVTTLRTFDIVYVRAWVDDPPGGLEEGSRGPILVRHRPDYDGITGSNIAIRYLSDTPTIFNQGDIVSVIDSGLLVGKSRLSYDANILGVVTESPGEIYGSETENTIPVALSGRVPVKVTNTNGKIKIGDPITSSNIPGVGMKAVGSGYIIGRALENLVPSEENNDEETSGSEVVQTVLVDLNPGYYNGVSLITNNLGNVGVGTTSEDYKFTVDGMVRSNGFAISSPKAKSITGVEDLAPEKYEELLGTISSINLSTYKYKNDQTGTTQLGILADDAPREILTVSGDIDLVKLSTLTFSGIKALNIKTDALAERITAIEAQIGSSTPIFSAEGIAESFEKLGAKISDGFAFFKNLVVETLTIGSREQPSGITLFDEKTGKPYCVKISSGKLKTYSGTCEERSTEEIDVDESGDEAPAPVTPNPDTLPETKDEAPIVEEEKVQVEEVVQKDSTETEPEPES